MRAFLFVLLTLCVVSFSVATSSKNKRVPGMTDREAYDQLVTFFENMGTPPSAENAALVDAVLASPMWIELDAEFGAKK